MSKHTEAIREALKAGCHTPGPWEVQTPYDGGRVLAVDDRSTVVHIPPCSPYNAQAIADASLIAACNPVNVAALLAERDALLEVAQAMCTVLEPAEVDFNEAEQTAMNRARCAIAKAQA